MDVVVVVAALEVVVEVMQVLAVLSVVIVVVIVLNKNNNTRGDGDGSNIGSSVLLIGLLYFNRIEDFYQSGFFFSCPPTVSQSSMSHDLCTFHLAGGSVPQLGLWIT